MNGVLDALKHFFLLKVRKWGDDLYSAIFYLTIFLYKNTISFVKGKMIKIKKTESYGETKLFVIM